MNSVQSKRYAECKKGGKITLVLDLKQCGLNRGLRESFEGRKFQGQGVLDTKGRTNLVILINFKLDGESKKKHIRSGANVDVMDLYMQSTHI